ncbi:DarT1-associated NADAR antitoxin family protein [Synechococcus elongatus]|uniref:DarT1-associated NADAR antitoxin family protein n=1 Tax=Synechococcus elongatus TaxID=32046 RepID=UPI000F7F744D|nr:hypothetical protein [Synechococcus elongatus]
MASRPVFVPSLIEKELVWEIPVEFTWHSGLSKSQVQKSIASLHEEAAKKNIIPILEISSKSKNHLGVSLSAFNLMLEVQTPRKTIKLSVECAYQGSKVFARGGPYEDLYYASSRDAKIDERLRSSGDFIGYSFFADAFPSQPLTAFYDWLYLHALSQNKSLSDQLFEFQGFSDIAFNPAKSLNCQARAAALFVTLARRKEIERVLSDRDYYLSLISGRKLKVQNQQLSIDF